MASDTTIAPKRASRRKRKRQHGTGNITKRGDAYQIRWREGGRQRSKSFTDEELARKALTKITKDVELEGVGLAPPKPLAPPLRQLAVSWLERRKITHRAAKDDENRWNRHLKPFFGASRPDDVDAAAIRRFVEAKLAAELNPATVGHCVRLLSTFYTELVELGHARANPVRTLPRSLRRLYRPTADPRNTPFLESLGDVRRVFLQLPDPISIAFAVGALGGLRTGELLGLDWRDVDLAGRRIHVRRQMQDGRLTVLKDDESRVVPIVAALLPLLSAYKLSSGGAGILFPAAGRGGRSERAATFMRPHTLHKYLRLALAACKLPETLTWYQCTRHTFASQWVLAGGSLEKLAVVMGHSSVQVTQRYAHLRPDLFRDSDLRLLDVDLVAPPADVVELRPSAPTVRIESTVRADAVGDEEDAVVNS